MDVKRWLVALAFGTAHTALFLAVPLSAPTLLGNIPLLLFLWVLAIPAAKWAIGGVDDLLRMTSRDAAALVVRGGLVGALVGGAVMTAALLPPLGIVWGVFLYGGLLGGLAGTAVGAVDVVVFSIVRLFAPRA